jgi:hypothetical protein
MASENNVSVVKHSVEGPKKDGKPDGQTDQLCTVVREILVSEVKPLLEVISVVNHSRDWNNCPSVVSKQAASFGSRSICTF